MNTRTHSSPDSATADNSSELTQRLSSILSPALKNMKAYNVQMATGMLKLDAMENPFQWPQVVRDEWLTVLAEVAVNRYPDASAQTVKAELRQAFAVPSEYPLLLGNGSDEIILLLMQAVLQENASVLAVEPSFVMYKQIANSLQLNYHGVDLTADFSLDTEAVVQAIDTHKPALIFLAIPNNPTGNVFSDAALQRIIEAATGLVVLDEAYTAFTDYDASKWLARYPHVVIMRTVSKIGLAGLRLGYMFAHEAVVNEVEKLRLPYNINSLTQATVAFILQHHSVLNEQTQQLCDNRKKLVRELKAVGLFDVYDSQANFVLAKVKAADGEQSAGGVFAHLKANKILIKCLDGGHPLLEECLRFTVGTQDENQQLVDCLKTLV